MEITAYLSRALDYIPIVSIGKGIYYIREANEKQKIIDEVAKQSLGPYKEEQLKQSNQPKIDAVYIRGILSCIPVIGNILLVIKDIFGQNDLDSIKELSDWKLTIPNA